MDEIYEILEELRPEFDFRKSENFVEDGFLDSFDIVSIISMVEEKYGINIDGLDILPENFETADAIAALIKKSGGNI
ncbi:MAG: acyl carrier protein [Lachnospiraceae bacterium]